MSLKAEKVGTDVFGALAMNIKIFLFFISDVCRRITDINVLAREPQLWQRPIQ
jgi:hypothetical protein